MIKAVNNVSKENLLYSWKKEYYHSLFLSFGKNVYPLSTIYLGYVLVSVIFERKDNMDGQKEDFPPRSYPGDRRKSD
jgi:hypothetical protein